ncbi:MAG: tyrosine-type recombinase/integrase [Pseudomonadota bacterium]
MNGERHLPTAKKLRDIFLAEVRRLEIEYRAHERFSVEKAEMWAQALKEENDKTLVRDLIYEETEKAPDDQQGAFLRVATATTLPLSKALEQYLEARAPDNPYGNKPLGASSRSETTTAVNYLCLFMKAKPETIFLDDVTPELVAEFQYEFLPKRPSKRPGKTRSPDTTQKNITMLRGLWRWAIARKKVALTDNPFNSPVDDLPRQVLRKEPKRDLFKPEETQKILAAAPQGDRLGDLFRVGLVSGARVTEIAKVSVSDTTEDGTVFLIAGGKTENAKRVVPVPLVAQPIIKRLREAAIEAREERLFHEFPINKSTGTAKSASKAFTSLRRRVLGRASDDRLVFHSLRHTWKTISRRAGLSLDDAHDLGGWAGVKRTSDPYDHGLNSSELAKAQEKVATLLSNDGYLRDF